MCVCVWSISATSCFIESQSGWLSLSCLDKFKLSSLKLSSSTLNSGSKSEVRFSENLLKLKKEVTEDFEIVLIY